MTASLSLFFLCPVLNLKKCLPFVEPKPQTWWNVVSRLPDATTMGEIDGSWNVAKIPPGHTAQRFKSTSKCKWSSFIMWTWSFSFCSFVVVVVFLEISSPSKPLDAIAERYVPWVVSTGYPFVAPEGTKPSKQLACGLLRECFNKALFTPGCVTWCGGRAYTLGGKGGCSQPRLAEEGWSFSISPLHRQESIEYPSPQKQ